MSIKSLRMIKMKKAILAVFLISAMVLTAFAAPVDAKIPSNSQYNRVAMVEDQTFDYLSPGDGDQGMLPEDDIAFANFTFTNLPWANLTAGNLTNFDIVVLCIDYLSPQPVVTPQQASDINAWIFAGGKLIIYDSEMTPQDYSWLVYPFNTTNPGAYAYTGSIVQMEDNTLGEDNDPLNTFYYINTTVDQDGNNWEDAIGDGNLFTTFDPHWCGDIEAINGEEVTGWMHAYAQYGSGMMIYDYGDNDTAPSSTGWAALAKIFLLELAQPWASDYNLPCGNPIAERVSPVGGTVIGVNTSALLMQFALAAVLIVAGLAVLTTLYHKKMLRTIH
jgi:hypothetical protein